MESEKTERKLAAILHADVVGYSRMMGEDEVGTLRTLTSYREVMFSLIEMHHGKVVGTAGDSVLAEFVSSFESVECAIEIQGALSARNGRITWDGMNLNRTSNGVVTISLVNHVGRNGTNDMKPCSPIPSSMANARNASRSCHRFFAGRRGGRSLICRHRTHGEQLFISSNKHGKQPGHGENKPEPTRNG